MSNNEILGSTNTRDLGIAQRIVQYFVADRDSDDVWTHLRARTEDCIARDRQRLDSHPPRFYYPFLQWWEGENPEYPNQTITEHFWDWQTGVVLRVARTAELVSIYSSA